MLRFYGVADHKARSVYPITLTREEAERELQALLAVEPSYRWTTEIVRLDLSGPEPTVVSVNGGGGWRVRVIPLDRLGA